MSVKILLALCGVVVASRATALQPLDVFLRGARTTNPDVAEAHAARRQLRAEADAALGRALPRLSLRGTYARNELETSLTVPGAGGGATRVTITPKDQVEGTATLDVPLVDLSSFARIAAARTGAAASARQEVSTDLATQSRVSGEYHSLAAALALVGASRRALSVAEASLRTADELHRAGSAPQLDVDRARAEVERNVQLVASAELDVSLAARSLRSLSGVEPELGGDVHLADDLHEEAPLERFQAADDELPALSAAIRSRVAAEQQAAAQRLALVPSLAASLTEHATNSSGFVGQDATWQAVVGLSWSLDLTTFAGIRAQDAAADGARAREQRVRLAARDDIHRAWMTVRTSIARSRSARVQAEVSGRAAKLALERWQAGSGTQLDVLQAQRDAFSADAARIQADAALEDARAQLRLAAGQSLVDRPVGGTP